MANGYKMDRGFLFDYAWEKQFRKLKPKDFYSLFWELYDYQKSGGDSSVDDHDNHVLMGSIVTFVVPQIRNRIIGSRHKKESEQCAQGTLPPTPRGTLPPTPRGTLPPTPRGTLPPNLPIDAHSGKGGTLPIDKLKENKIRENKLESNAPAPAQENPTKSAYGEFANVFLTENERKLLADIYGQSTSEGLIDNFSRKIKAKGYQYEDHYATILDWANKDGVKLRSEKSYDIEDFLNAALARSYENVKGD